MPAAIDTFRRLATSLPKAYESSHMGHPDFRIATPDGKGRIFATLSAEQNGRGVLKLTLEQQQAFVAELPHAFEPVQGGWGRMGMTYVHLDQVEEDILLGGLTTAHHNVMAKLETVRPKPVPGRKAARPIKTSQPKITL